MMTMPRQMKFCCSHMIGSPRGGFKSKHLTKVRDSIPTDQGNLTGGRRVPAAGRAKTRSCTCQKKQPSTIGRPQNIILTLPIIMAKRPSITMADTTRKPHIMPTRPEAMRFTRESTPSMPARPIWRSMAKNSGTESDAQIDSKKPDRHEASRASLLGRTRPRSGAKTYWHARDDAAMT